MPETITNLERYTDEQIKEVMTMRMEGHSMRDLSDITGVPLATVRDWLAGKGQRAKRIKKQVKMESLSPQTCRVLQAIRKNGCESAVFSTSGGKYIVVPKDSRDFEQYNKGWRNELVGVYQWNCPTDFVVSDLEG